MSGIKTLIIRVLALTVAMVPVRSDGSVLRVPQDYGTINAALDVSAAGDTVLVAPGTYTEAEVRTITIGPPITVASIAFLKDGVVLLSEAGPDATVLDMAGKDYGATRAWVLVGGQFTTDMTSVEGFSVTGTPFGSRGMTVAFSTGAMTVRNCAFYDMDAGSIPEGDGQGGGIFANEIPLLVEDSVFLRCRADGGGAIATIDRRVEIVNSRFEDCEHRAVWTRSVIPTDEIVLTDCEFVGNSAEGIDGGAVGVGTMDRFVVERCFFEANVSDLSGGAISSKSTDLEVRESVFFQNSAIGLASGGAIVAFGGAMQEFTENTFVANSQEASQYGGGTVRLDDSSFDLRNNIIANSSGGLAAVQVISGAVTTLCNVFWANEVDVEGFALGPTDRNVDPEFCDVAVGDLTLRDGSPCLPKYSMGCGLIGALGKGCGFVALEAESWGRIKARFLSR